MRIVIVTLFPDLVAQVLSFGVLGRAVARDLLSVETVDPRQFATDPHRTVDDRPYGGGPGMVMKAEPLRQAVELARERAPGARRIYLAADGRPVDQARIAEFAGLPGLILVAGRLVIPSEQYEAASVDGASGWQKFRFITWPAMRSLYLTSLILSMIWTLGDFNSVYLLTGGGPADLTHVLATLGIRYLRLDQVDLAMASIVVALPLVLPLVYFMMKRLSK